MKKSIHFIKAELTLFMLIICYLSAYSQPFTMTLSTQAEVDNFSLYHPNTTTINGVLEIKSDSDQTITNLDGLAMIDSITNSLTIIGNDNLIDLSGLSNLKYVQYNVNIFNNEQLESLQGLDNINLSLVSGRLTIWGCPNLNECSVPSICDYLHSYGDYIIKNNGTGCMNRQEIIDECSLSIDTSNLVEFYSDSFENWDNINDTLVPVGWGLNTSDVLSYGRLHIERVGSISDGEYAALVRSNQISLEGNSPISIYQRFDTLRNGISVSFDFKCLLLCILINLYDIISKKVKNQHLFF